MTKTETASLHAFARLLHCTPEELLPPGAQEHVWVRLMAAVKMKGFTVHWYHFVEVRDYHQASAAVDSLPLRAREHADGRYYLGGFGSDGSPSAIAGTVGTHPTSNDLASFDEIAVLVPFEADGATHVECLFLDWFQRDDGTWYAWSEEE